MQKFLSKAVIFTFENHTITYNGTSIVVVDRKTSKIVATEESKETEITVLSAALKLSEMLKEEFATA